MKTKNLIGRQALTVGLLLTASGCAKQASKSVPMPHVSAPIMVPTPVPTPVETDKVQLQANEEYAKLYDTVLEAKLKADKKGKKLIILAGESHQNIEALLYEYMLLDIAMRLNITNAVFEFSQNEIDRSAKDSKTILNDLDPKKLLAGKPSDQVYFGSNIELMATSVLCKYPIINGGPLSNMDLTLLTTANTGMKRLPGDPYHAERGRLIAKHHDFPFTNKYAALKAKHEKAMADAIGNSPGDCIAFNGAWHIMPIYKLLKNTGHEVLVINCCPDQNFDVPTKLNREIFESRIKPLKKFYTPKVDGVLAPLPFWALKISLLASSEHRYQHGEISQKLYEGNQFVFTNLPKDLLDSFIKEFSKRPKKPSGSKNTPKP